jgi:hypothetical protein
MQPANGPISFISGVLVDNSMSVGYTGYDCSRQWCPTGDDPLTEVGRCMGLCIQVHECKMNDIFYWCSCMSLLLTVLMGGGSTNNTFAISNQAQFVLFFTSMLSCILAYASAGRLRSSNLGVQQQHYRELLNYFSRPNYHSHQSFHYG